MQGYLGALAVGRFLWQVNITALTGVFRGQGEIAVLIPQGKRDAPDHRSSAARRVSFEMIPGLFESQPAGARAPGDAGHRHSASLAPSALEAEPAGGWP